MKDPITGREISRECWDSDHERMETLMDPDGVKRAYKVGCLGFSCKCGCHERVSGHRIKRGPKSDQTLMEVYGTIQIGEDKPAKRMSNMSTDEKQTALQLVQEQKKTDLQQRLEAFAAMDSFDWKALKPHQMATVLMKKPYRGKAGEPDYYLSPEQALVFAMRSFELNLSPLSGEVWFDRDRWTTNVTLEGKIKLARERGVTGAPVFKSEERDWRKGSVPLAGYAKEPGITATIKAGDGECNYTCWLSEWIVPSSPVWKAKPEHMLRIRAYDKALAFASGVGVSEMPSEKEIDQTVDAEPPSAPAVKTSRVPFVPQTAASMDDLAPVLQASIDAQNKSK